MFPPFLYLLLLIIKVRNNIEVDQRPNLQEFCGFIKKSISKIHICLCAYVKLCWRFSLETGWFVDTGITKQTHVH